MTNKPIQPRTLLEALDSSLLNSSWLTPADEVSIQWAKYLAAKLDNTTELQEVAKIGKLFETVTRDLGLSIAGRSTKPDEPQREVSPLDQIRLKIVSGESTAKSPDAPSTGVRKSSPRPRSTSRSSGNASVGVAKKRSSGNPKN